MASRKKKPTDKPADTDPRDPEFEPAAQRELIVMVRPEAGVRVSREGVESVTAPATVQPLAEFVRAQGVTLEPLFGESEERLENERTLLATAAPGAELPNLSVFYSVKAPDEQLDELADKLSHDAAVEAAYVKPAAEPPSMTTDPGVRDRDTVLHPPGAAEREEELAINDMAPSPGEAPFTTPDFTARQGYLGPAPAGVDARYAWTVPGGRGDGVQIIDCEWGWRFNHEDLRQNQGGVIAGANSSDDNHGTAVMGEISGDDNGLGIVGICPNARVMAVSFTTLRTAQAIRLAANRLRAGDIMLLEIHRPGPRFNFQGRADQRGYIAIEWWPDDYAAIRYAVSRGIVVVEAAGNGAEDFDDPLYDQRPAGFPSSWRNPFNLANPSSEAVVVGAGAPPPGTHGHNHGPDRSRLGFSNFGRRVDCQGWGREVTSTGYGDLQGGSNRDMWYTDQFSGTSSASPIVVGALGAVQGILRARAQPLLDSPRAIRLLRATGSPQQDAPGRPRTQRIGNRPDLAQMIRRMIPVATVPLYRYWNPQIGDHFYTTDLRELGHGRYGWRYEQVQCQVYPRRMAGTVPLYRYWNSRIGDHFYTTNWGELGYGRYGWRFERVQGYVHASRARGTVALYRYWNPGIGDHFYTTDWRELGYGRYGWRFERVQCYVVPRAAGVRPEAGGEAFAPAELEAEWAPDVHASRFESRIGGNGEEMPQASFATDIGERGGEPYAAPGHDLPAEALGSDIGAESFTVEGGGTGAPESSFVTEETRTDGNVQSDTFTTAVERTGATETTRAGQISITINT